MTIQDHIDIIFSDMIENVSYLKVISHLCEDNIEKVNWQITFFLRKYTCIG